MSMSQDEGSLQNVRVSEGFELNRSRDIEVQLYNRLQKTDLF